MSATFSHVILLIGFGSSCSHPLFVNRPSNTDGSGMIEISSESPAAVGAVEGCDMKAAFTDIDFVGAALFGIIPSWTIFRQLSSKVRAPVAAACVAGAVRAAGEDVG